MNVESLKCVELRILIKEYWLTFGYINDTPSPMLDLEHGDEIVGSKCVGGMR